MCGLCLHRFFDLLIERVIWHILCVQSKQRRLMYTQWLNAHAYRRSLREEPPVRTTAGRSGLTHTRILRIINLCSAMHYEQISSTASIETANTRLNGNIWIGHCVILQCRVESVTWYININWPFIMFLLLCVVTKSVCEMCVCVCAHRHSPCSHVFLALDALFCFDRFQRNRHTIEFQFITQN